MECIYLPIYIDSYHLGGLEMTQSKSLFATQTREQRQLQTVNGISHQHLRTWTRNSIIVIELGTFVFLLRMGADSDFRETALPTRT